MRSRLASNAEVNRGHVERVGYIMDGALPWILRQRVAYGGGI